MDCVIAQTMDCMCNPCMKVSLQIYSYCVLYAIYVASYIHACMMLIKLVGIYACMLHDQQDATYSNYNCKQLALVER